jgi:hypothetical protein
MNDQTPTALSVKLLEVMKDITWVEKRGENTFHNYKYATESDLVEMVRGKLSSRGIRTRFNLVSTARVAKGDKGGFITDIEVDWSFVDSQTGEIETSRVPGSGEDKGDKGVYKALTGSEKYWLMKTFLIPTGDDPENDGGSGREQRQPQPQQSAPASAPQQAPPQRGKMPTRGNAATSAKPVNGRAPEEAPVAYEGNVDRVEYNQKDGSYWMLSGDKYFWTRESAVGHGMSALTGSRAIVTGVPSATKPNTFQLLTIAKVEAN